MKAPSLLEEKSAIGLDRSVNAENMVKRRDGDTVRMASLDRLLKLPGSPRSTILSAAWDTARTFASDICAASSTNRTSTMLGGVGTRPKPAGCAANLQVAMQAVDKIRIIGRQLQIRQEVVLIGDLLDTSTAVLVSAAATRDLSRRWRMTLWLFAVTRRSPLLPGKRTDHACAGVGLASSGRALHGKTL